MRLWMGILWQCFGGRSTRPKGPLIQHMAKHGPEAADSVKNWSVSTNWVGGYSRKDMSEMHEGKFCLGKVIICLKE